MKYINKTHIMQNLKFWLPLFFAIFYSFSIHSQTIIVNGTVTGEEDGLPIPGVNVLIKDSAKGTSTNFDGNYAIEANLGDVLIFTYLGLKSQSLKVKSSTMNVKMELEASSLDEIIVIGYGTQSKKEVTGAVSQVKAKEIANIITPDVSSALRGQVAGLNVTSSSGEPGEGSGILIRGVSSLTGSNDPLFVVDGVPQSGDPQLNPNEIETIDVLKDAASASIYGVRASGGVILITTRRGKEGNAKIEFNYSNGIQQITRRAPLMNTNEQIFFDLNDQSRGTPFSPARSDRFSLLNDNEPRDLVQNDNAILRRANLNISGGNENSNYNFTLGYFDQEGNVINSSLKRYNLRGGFRIKKSRWSFNNSFGFTIDDRERPNFNLLILAQRAFPYLERVDANSSNITDDSDERLSNINQLLGALTRRRELGRYRFDASSEIGYKIGTNLTFKMLTSGVVTNEFETQTQPPFQTFDQAGNPQQTEFDNFVYEFRSRRVLINWNGSLNYVKDFGNHGIEALALFSVEQDNFTSIGTFAQGLLFDNPTNLSQGTVGADAASNGLLLRGTPFIDPDFRDRRIGSIGRLQYNYDGKYLLSVSGRYDGSNKFGPGNQYAFFPSASAGWNISEEKFWGKIKSVVNNLKFRASYGTSGNDRIQSYSFQNVLLGGFDAVFQDSSGSSIVSPGAAVTRYGNSNLKWETSTQSNFGIDANFFQNTLELTFDYYTGNKKDLLVNLPIASSFGGITVGDLFANQRFTPFNVGDMKNSGFETSLRYRPKTGQVRWNILGTFTTNKNEIVRLNGDINQQLFNTFPVFNDGRSNVIGLQVGREAGSFLVFPTDGLLRTQAEVDTYNTQFNTNAQIGDLRYIDTDGNGELRNNGDRIYGGSGLPDFEIGLNLSATYKNWYFNTNWYASVGNEVYNATRANAINDRRSRDLIYQFIPGVNENTNIPTFRGRSPLHPNFRPDTDFFIEDGSFLRLTNLVVSYRLPSDVTDKLGLGTFNIYANAQNVLTLTEYSGLDPEVGGNNIQRRGLDIGVIPITASYNLGVRLNF
ncbi:TonB-dependent receptor [uncultured Aquimarina sp.]|uniref:SusC/RagA family TonB-linked outer membrane protein n=1 Tax=uncultured Aquimarina sp. TaxID=575652 RepID=UPI00261AFE2B|nr:TonB-dependent receptor [uncultured Aquimarina sp.]